MTYHTELLSLARKLTGIFALALGMPEDHFDDHVQRPEAGMRIIHYPAQEASAADQNGIGTSRSPPLSSTPLTLPTGAHTDFESFTLVTQDASPSGLEVLSKSNRWIRAPPIQGTFIVNIADCFMRQTNDYFVSTVHRVVNKSGRERFSLPFFSTATDGNVVSLTRLQKLEPVPSCVSEERMAKYPVMTGGEYYQYRVQTAKTKQR